MSLLRQVEEIDGYLQILNVDHQNFTDLRFLHRLHTIHGNQLVQILSRQYSLIVEENAHLRTLNLASLHTVARGGVRVSQNPQLCLVGTVMETLAGYVENGTVRVAGLGDNEECRGITTCCQ